MPPHGRSDPGHGSGPPRYPGTFLLAFGEAVAEMQWQVRRWMGHLVECRDADGREHIVGLENLFRRARQVPREQWPALVVEFLRTASSIQQDDALPADLSSVTEQLLVRLGQPLDTMPNDAKVWSQPLGATGLCLNLVIDHADRMFYVTEKLVTDSGRPAGEWLEQAIANLRARTPPDCFAVVHEESGMLSCTVADAYDSSRALLLDALLPNPCADGYFVAVPGRDQLMVMPVNLEGLSAVHLLKVLADKTYRTTPYAITNDLFWVRQRAWQIFPIDVHGEKVTVQPPDEFVEVLKRLIPEGELIEPEEPPETP